MKHAFASTSLSIAWLLLAFGSPGWAQHPGAPSTSSHETAASAPSQPVNATVEFENESILVLRIRMAPHEKTPMHDIGTARLVVWLTDVDLRDTQADGQSNDIHRRAGDVDWVPIQRHAGENLAQEPLEFLAIVPKVSERAGR